MAEPPQKKFRWTSYNEKLRDISVDAGTSRGTGWEREEFGDDVEQTRTPLTSELARLALHDLTLPYQDLSRELGPLTTTLPITLLNLSRISAIFSAFYSSLKEGTDHADSGLDSALHLHRALYETCLSEAITELPETTKQLLRVGALRALEPKLVERTYSTLSQIFRITAPTLLKSESREILLQAWSEVRPYLRPKQNKRVIRKCVADAWVGVIRKARGDGLARSLDVLLEGEYEGMEAVWTESMKGTGNAFHSRAAAILGILLDRLAASPSESQTATLGSVITALVHHGSSTTLSPIVETIIARIDTSSGTTLVSSPPSSMLTLLSVTLLVRKGKRFPDSLLKPTMMKLLSLASSLDVNVKQSCTEDPSWRRALVQAVVGTLLAGKLANWLSPGVSLIEALWNGLDLRERFAFVDTLVTLKWAGIEQFLLPHVAKTALPSLATDPLPTLVLLNSLSETGFLSGGLLNVQGGRWRQGLIVAVRDLLASLASTSLGEAERRTVGQLLRLLPVLASDGQQYLSTLLDLVRRFTRDADSRIAETTWKEGVWNDSHLLSAVLRSCIVLSRARDDVRTQMQAELLERKGLATLIRGWRWNREVLDNVAEFAEEWNTDLRLSDEQLQPVLPNLLSADSSLRLSALRILSAARPAAESSSSAGTIWAHCLQVEQSEMTLRNVRERTTNIARLSRLLLALPDDLDEDVQGVVRHVISYLLSQLKVSFRPLWAEIVGALSSLAQRHADDIWTAIWSELEKTHAATVAQIPDFGVEKPDWASIIPSQRKSEDDEEDPEFKCPNLEKSRRVLSTSWSNVKDEQMLDRAEIESQISEDRLDVLNYEAQLLAVLAAVPSMAEKHTRALVPMFLIVSGHDDSTKSPFSTRQLQQRTASFLELLAKFVNPKAAFRTDELHEVYLDILARGDAKLQGLALGCLISYKSPKVVPYEDNLRALLDDSKFRDELVHFDLGVDGGIIDQLHRDELVPITIRILYGIITSKRGRSSAQAAAGRKQAALSALTPCTSGELATLIDLMTEPFASGAEGVAGRQQLGFLSLLGDVLRYIGPQTVDHWPRLIETTISLVESAQKRLSNETEFVEEQETDEVPEGGNAPLRNIRSMGIKRLVQFARSRTDFDLAPFLPAIYSSVISPRIDKLEIENTQAPSGILDLIAAFAATSSTADSLSGFDERVLPKVFACMVAVKVKPSVIGRVFDVIESLLMDSQAVLLPYLDALLSHLIRLVEQLKHSPSEDLMRPLLSILSRLSTSVTNGPQAQQLAGLLGPMLRQSNKQLPEKGKINVLETLQRLFAISPDFADPASTFFTQHYELVSNLFQSLFAPFARRALVAALEVFAKSDPSLVTSVQTVADINAYSTRRMEEPDFDRRLTAFARLNDGDETPASPREWLPLIRSALFFIREPEELSIRTNASSLLRRFVSLVGDASTGSYVDTLSFVVLPGLRQTLRSKLELVRNEALLVISHAVKTCSGVPALVEMRVLLAEGDDEANFFSNMVHIQVHRRARAIRRLREVDLSEKSISGIFLPLLEHIINGATDVTDHHLVNEAILSIGALAKRLRWPRYNALLMRFLRLGSTKTPQQKFYIRAMSAIIDNFHFDQEAKEIVEADGDELEDEDADEATAVGTRITEVVLTRLLPALSRFVVQKDEAEDAIRIPVALGIVKIAAALPSQSSEVEILRIITTVSQILRSKDQDTRDLTRETICKIAVFLGPHWLPRVLKELREALQRGPQKHVLAVTTHAILVQATSTGDRFDLDDAAEDAVQISAEVVWGESGKDVESEGFKTKMREVRGASSRGFDTFQLVSRLVSPNKISDVLSPLRDVMHASQAVKTMLHVDEALRRIALGLNANERLVPQDILALCFSLISGNSSYLRAKRKAKTAQPDRFSVQMKRNSAVEEDFYPLNAHKFVAFGLDLFVTAFRRGKFDFDDVDILSRLGPLVSAIGNSLYSTHTVVLSLALKASAAIVRCPIPQVEAALPVFITNVFKVVKLAGGAESDLAQTALKTLAVIIRDCKASEISDNQLKYLLEVVSPDLEEPDRQGAIFAALRAVVSRKFVVPEIYDLMDRVSSIMVTSQSTLVQEQCRALLMQFLLDYPQGTGRLKQQMTFLARNLDYVFESGRISVMELLSAIFAKFSDELLQEYADMFFIALVAVLANDDSEKCRTMAGALIRQLFGRLDAARQRKMLAIIGQWVAAREENHALAGAAMAVFGLLIDEEVDVDELLDMLRPIIEDSAQLLTRAEAGEDTSFDHTLPLQAISTIAKAIRAHPSTADRVPWSAVVSHLLFPHDWVRFASARALTVLFAANQETASAFDVLEEEDLLELAKKSCLLLKGSKTSDGEARVVDGKLADQLVKLLWNVSKHWAGQEADGGTDGQEGDEPDKKRPLAWLMSRMSFLARHLIVNRPAAHDTFSGDQWTAPVMSILRFFAGVFEHLEVEQSKRFLPHILTPVHRILDDNGDLASASGPSIDELRQLATEVRDFVQNKVGTSDFSHAWEGLRQRTRGKREERREERNRMAVADPQGWADRKEKRGIMKKESKKRKIKAFADTKQRERPTKRRG